MKRIIRNGTVVGPYELLPGSQLLIEDGIIRDVLPTDASVPGPFRGPDVDIIDADGGLITPGLIDIHSDHIERMTAPRPSSIMDFTVALHETERELMIHGITTMYHSLSFNDAGAFRPSHIRSPQYTRRFLELISDFRRDGHLIHHRFHARFEISSIHRLAELTQYIERGLVHLLSLTDHTPGQGQYHDVEMYRKTMKGYRDLSDDELDRIVADRQAQERLDRDALRALVDTAHKHEVSVASHDDDTIEKLELNREIGVNISEFPVHPEVARAAHEMGFRTVAGGPNILLGGSHTGNLSAAEAVKDGSIDIVCSDYYPASLLHAVFILHNDYGLDLPHAFRLVTLNAAVAVGIDHERGSIEPGKSADLLVIHRMGDGFPAVNTVVISGRVCMHMRYRTHEAQTSAQR